MANTYSKDDLRILYQSLPEALQEVILAPETFDQYAEVAKKFALSETQQTELSNQSGLLLLGITQPQQFIIALSEKLNVEREQATLIAQELNKNVFNSVKDALKEVHKGEVETKSVAPIEVPTTGPVTPVASVKSTLVMPEIAKPEPSAGSIFEQKLGGTFRMNADGINTGGEGMPKNIPSKLKEASPIMFTPLTPPTV